MSDDFLKKRREGIMDNRPGKHGPKKQKPISKRSEKGILRAEDKKTLLQEDMVLYLEIWKERKHEDFETGEPLPDKPVLSNFHHLLYKSPNNLTDYSIYRHSKWNIVLVSKNTHDNTHADIDSTPKIKALTELLKEQHEQGLLKP